jgi:hypothetical protein
MFRRSVRSNCAAVLAAVLFGAPALAQVGPPAPFPNLPPQPPPRRFATSSFDVQKKATSSFKQERRSALPLQVSAARKLASQLQIPCDVVDAGLLSDRPTKDPSYELVCKDAIGWIILHRDDGGTQVADCLAWQDSASAAGHNWPRGLECLMPANSDPIVGLKPLAKRVSSACDLADAAFLGSGGQPAITRYELACRNGQGYVVDQPAPGSKASFSSITCADAAKVGAPCKLPAGGKAKTG